VLAVDRDTTYHVVLFLHVLTVIVTPRSTSTIPSDLR